MEMRNIIFFFSTLDSFFGPELRNDAQQREKVNQSNMHGACALRYLRLS